LINFPSQAAFVTKFGHLFEHSPWVVERAWALGPFADEDALHAAMMRVVAEVGTEAQLGLIRAHPELAARTALTAESESEQAGAGLKHLTPAEFERFAELNAAYREKFGFPFIICVRLQTKASIFAAFEQRLQNDMVEEQARALQEIGLITRLRLQDMGATA
jgi:OHCU decarboxylase